MLVFGGTIGGYGDGPGDAGYGNEVWAVSLDGKPVWTLLSPGGLRPAPRSSHSAIYDPIRDRMIVFGGFWQGGSSNEVWALTLSEHPEWTLLEPAGPSVSGRAGHTAIYDPVRDRMVVFGGSGQTDTFWALSLAGNPTWTRLGSTSEPIRFDHTAIYDPVRDRMVVFGGRDGNFLAAREFLGISFADGSWGVFTDPGTPTSFTEHTAIYDPVRDQMVVLGGEALTWIFSFAGNQGSWSQLSSAGTAPTGRHEHTSIYDPVGERMIVFSGWNTNDLWALSLAATPTWNVLAPAGPMGRQRHAAIYDSLRDRMVVFGGLETVGDVWQFSLGGVPTSSSISTIGDPPTHSGFSAIYDPVRDRIIVFGGGNGNEVWALSFADNTWSLMSPTGTPPLGRSFASAIYDPARDRMVIFGGARVDPDPQNEEGRYTYFNDAWALTLGDGTTWGQVTSVGTQPNGRSMHTAIYDPARDRMVVFGGYQPDIYCFPCRYRNEVWALQLGSDPEWSLLAPQGDLPSGRTGHSAVLDPLRDRMVVFGGFDGANRNDVWMLQFAGGSEWVQLSAQEEAPTPRKEHTAIYDPRRDRMIVFGGDFRRDDLWMLTWDAPVPTLVSLVNAEAEPNRVVVSWQGLEAMELGSIERRTLSTDWQQLATLSADGTGAVRYEDRDVRPGGRYAYRLIYSTNGMLTSTPDHWIEVPIARFALQGLWPNPAFGGIAVSFSLPSREPATLELFDLFGRSVLSRAIRGLNPGVHRLELNGASALPPGVYTIRLRQGERSALARGVLLR